MFSRTDRAMYLSPSPSDPHVLLISLYLDDLPYDEAYVSNHLHQTSEGPIITSHSHGSAGWSGSVRTSFETSPCLEEHMYAQTNHNLEHEKRAKLQIRANRTQQILGYVTVCICPDHFPASLTSPHAPQATPKRKPTGTNTSTILTEHSGRG
ncbi:hypothetical protein Pmani_022382 [Petrolisthes manimaculis]|uniref:Uncharacterized protein n=1 Tax=Petrolisthes manimaculis TaxID=1843537 RepID=A0AAE1PEK6_9EUCA|nr:hypothetical protein Pmani_022382 [Petrolisthes manimaculis]